VGKYVVPMSGALFNGENCGVFLSIRQKSVDKTRLSNLENSRYEDIPFILS
jgi:hypothetical protein